MRKMSTILQEWLLIVLLTSEVLADCNGGNTVYTSEEGTITSPGWPNYYYPNLDCTWYVNLQDKGYPAFFISEVAIESGDNCEDEFLEIVDGGRTLSTFCGRPDNLPAYVTALSHTVLVRFVTDHMGVDRGFMMQWNTSQTPGVITTTAAPNATTTESPPTDYTYMAALIPIALIVALICIYTSWRKKKQQETRVIQPAQRAALRVTANANPFVSSEPPPPYQRYETGGSAPPSPEPPKQETGPLHIMISYQWAVKPRVLKFKERLQGEGYRVWIDVEQIHKSETTYEAMAIAVRQASVVVPVMTNKYPTSENCKKEIQFAAKCQKPIVPVKMESSFHPKDDWLIELLDNIPIYNLSEPETYEQEFTNFLGTVANIGVAARIEPGEEKEYNVFHRQATSI